MRISLSPIREALADERLLQRVLQDGLHVGGELSFPAKCHIICLTKKPFSFSPFTWYAWGMGLAMVTARRAARAAEATNRMERDIFNVFFWREGKGIVAAKKRNTEQPSVTLWHFDSWPHTTRCVRLRRSARPWGGGGAFIPKKGRRPKWRRRRKRKTFALPPPPPLFGGVGVGASSSFPSREKEWCRKEARRERRGGGGIRQLQISTFSKEDFSALYHYAATNLI